MRSLAFVSLCLSSIFFACDVGVVSDEPNDLGQDTGGDTGSSGVDDGNGDGVIDDGDGGDDGDPQGLVCQDPPAGLGSGEHLAGAACLDCHNGIGAPLFTVAGTLYKTADGADASPAGTVTVVDANGLEIILTSMLNGNFYTDQAVVLPLTVKAENCGAERPMNASAQTGDCNSCHGNNARIY